MTNCEYILKTLSLFGITQDTVDIIMLDASLNGEADCNVNACKRAILSHEALVRICTKRNVSEGGFSLSWSDAEEELNMFFGRLADELGEEQAGVSRLRDISNIW